MMKNNRRCLYLAAGICALLCAVCAFLLPVIAQRIRTLEADMAAVDAFLQRHAFHKPGGPGRVLPARADRVGRGRAVCLHKPGGHRICQPIRRVGRNRPRTAL